MLLFIILNWYNFQGTIFLIIEYFAKIRMNIRRPVGLFTCNSGFSKLSNFHFCFFRYLLQLNRWMELSCEMPPFFLTQLSLIGFW